jgi:neuroligin
LNNSFIVKLSAELIEMEFDNFSVSLNHQDWHFMDESPEDLVRKSKFNRGLHYMTGVTTQEAAYLICKN